MTIAFKLSRICFILLLIISPCRSINAQQQSPLHVMYQDIAWAPDKSALYFSAMKVKRDFSDFVFTKWSIYKYDMKTGKISTFADSALWVSVSRNKDIVFGKIVKGNQNLWIVDSLGKTRILTADSVNDYCPSWSPDGKTVAFNRRMGKGHTQIFTINADGTNLTQLTSGDSVWAASPVWAPDGKHLVYYQEKGDRKDQVFVMKPDGSGKTNLTKDSLNNFYPAWIDNTRIMYTRSYPNDMKEIFLIKSDGTEKAPLLTLQSFFARYSPDASMIAYIDNQQQGIHIINPIGQEIKRIVLKL